MMVRQTLLLSEPIVILGNGLDSFKLGVLNDLILNVDIPNGDEVPPREVG